MRQVQHTASDQGSGARPHWSVVLRALREARGVTLEGWAARIGVSRATVQRWERGVRAPDPGAEAAILAYCQQQGLFRSYESGPLAGLTLTAEVLQELLVAARWRIHATPAADGAPAPPSAPAPEAAPSGPPVSPTRLPAPLTSFIGRERELGEIRRVQADTRLLTLTGAGGSGKTRLALALAGELLWAYPHGVWWVDLAPLADPALLARTVASVLAIRPSAQQQPADALAGALQARHLLLVLDNCEHLLPSCAELVETLLRACPHLEVMATSRESLGIGGEVVWRIPPLSLPEETGAPGTSDAVRLFIERARLQQPGLTVSAEDAAAIAGICRRLDGMPLAIELAAARVNVLSVGQIAERLRDRFQLLTSGGRTALSRHQTLRAAMDWSYDLLIERERTLLRALSVFAGGFTLEAAEAVCGAEGFVLSTVSKERNAAAVPTADVLDLLARLVDKSLVVADTQDGEVRYRLLETVRQYAREALAAVGEEQALQQRHALWCLALAEAAWPYRSAPAQTGWLARLETEHDNLRGALAWGLTDHEGAAVATNLAGLLSWFWELRGHLAEGRRWLTALLEQAAHVPLLERARAMEGAGRLAIDLGDYDDATRLLEQCLVLRREVGDDLGIAGALNNLGMIAGMTGDNDRARNLFEETLMIARRIGDPVRLGATLNNLGIVSRDLGDLARSVAYYEEGLAIARALGDRHLLSSVVLNLGNIHQQREEHGPAVTRYREGLSLSQDLEDRRGAARCLQGLARSAMLCGDAERAVRLSAAAAAMRAAIGLDVPAAGRARFEETIKQARAALGDEAYAAAWAAGHALSLDEAVAEALREPERPLGE